MNIFNYLNTKRYKYSITQHILDFSLHFLIEFSCFSCKNGNLSQYSFNILQKFKKCSFVT